MKLKFILGLILFLFLATPVSAHQPEYVGSNIKINVTNPEISKAYYGELNGQPAVYTIESQKEFKFYVNILVPDLIGEQKKLFDKSF